MFLLLINFSFFFGMNLEKYKQFRFVKSRTKPCRNLKRCSLKSCALPSNGMIDIRELKETNTGYKGKAKWMEIYKTCSTPELRRLVSGIHFSISVHIAKNYFKFLWWYLPNPLYLRKKYKEEHEANFFELYEFVKAAVLKEDAVHLNLEDFEFFLIQREILSSLSPSQRWTKPRVYLSDLRKILDLINCLDCDKCRILGNIQFEGLKEAVKALGGKRISKDGFIYLALFFRKLSRTVLDIPNLKMNIFLSSFLWYFDYFVYLVLICIFMRLIQFFYSQNERSKRKDSEGS